MRVQIIVATCAALLAGCDRLGDTSRAEVETLMAGKTNLLRERLAVPCGRLHEKIVVTNVVVRESEGGYYTDNRFSCNVISIEDCELWLEVRDIKDGRQFNEVKDERTRRKVHTKPNVTNSKYDVDFVIDGDGGSVEALLTLWGSNACCGTASVLLRTNGVFGTWKGR